MHLAWLGSLLAGSVGVRGKKIEPESYVSVRSRIAGSVPPLFLAARSFERECGGNGSR